MSQNYELTIQGVDQLLWTNRFCAKYLSTFKPDLFVEVYINKKSIHRTNIVQGNPEATWNDRFTVPTSASESTELVIKLMSKTNLPAKKCYGIVKVTIETLLQQKAPPLRLQPDGKKSGFNARGNLYVNIKTVGTEEALKNAVEAVELDLQRQHIDNSTKPDVPEALNTLADTVSDGKDVLASIVTVLEKVQQIAVVTSKVMGVLARAYAKQVETDKSVRALFNQMEDLYSFVDDLAGLPDKIIKLERTVVHILNQTTECAIFVREYTEHGFVGRLLRQAISDHSTKTLALSNKLKCLMDALNDGVVVHTAFLSSHIQEDVSELLQRDILNALNPAVMDGANRLPCVPGTRKDQLEEIIEWLMTPSTSRQNILWVYGGVGLGKSAISTTIAKHFSGIQRRGAFLFFDRKTPIAPTRIISTLAYQLAEHDGATRSAISIATQQRRQLISEPIDNQFSDLLLHPLSAMATTHRGPVIIIIDALDECGDVDSRRALLALLSKEFAELPSQFRLLITSRPERDIEAALGSCPHVHPVSLLRASDDDMSHYIHHEMERTYNDLRIVAVIPPNWLDGLALTIKILVEYAQGIFIWAATAMRILYRHPDPVTWLADLQQNRRIITLDRLYETALLSNFGWEGEMSDTCRRIFGVIVVTPEPLNDKTIGELLGFVDAEGTCRRALHYFRSVIQWSPGQPAQVLHESFPEYLTDEKCSSKPWFIDIQEHRKELAPAFQNLAIALRTRFDKLGHMPDLEQAITFHRGVIDMLPSGHPDSSAAIGYLAQALSVRFDQSGQKADLQQVITLNCGALERTPPGHPNRSSTLENLALALLSRFEQLGQTPDLEQSIAYQQDSLDLRPPGHPDRGSSLSSLAKALLSRFEQLGQIADLEQSITYQRDALDLRPPGHPDRGSSLSSLAKAWLSRFEQLGQIADLEHSIIYQRDALDLRPPGHPDRGSSLSSLAKALLSRFEQLGQIADLEQSIAYQQDALDLRLPGHPDRGSSLSNLAIALRTQFDQLGQMEDLEQSITSERAALDLRPPGHPRRGSSLSSLAKALLSRFEQLGRIADLEQSITYQRDALDLRPPGHPDRGSSLSSLAKALLSRFEQLGQIADLEQSIAYQQDALDLRLPGHPDRGSSLSNLAIALRTQFDQLGQMEDLEQSITSERAALDLRPPGHPRRESSLSSLAKALLSRFEQLGQIADLEQSITYQRDALDLRPPGHPDRGSSLSNLAIALLSRFEPLGQIADLEQSITYQRDALDLRPPGHPDRGSSLSSLAKALQTRFDQFGGRQNIDQAVELLLSGTKDSSATPKHRYDCACQLITLLKKHDRSLLLQAYEMAIGLLQLVLAAHPDIDLRLQALGTHHMSPFLAMSAAAYAIEQGHPEKAVELLEQGRAILWLTMRGNRCSVEGVRKVDEVLADRFKATSDQLEALATSPNSMDFNVSPAVSEARWTQQRLLASERDEIIQQIRRLVGFEHFLSATPFSELQKAAAEGPVIIVNVAETRSDAIIVHEGGPPIVVPVSMDPENWQSAYLTFQKLSKQLYEWRGEAGFSNLLKRVILKLEVLLVTPVLQKLEELGVRQHSRIWWCPTSALCALPIHAVDKLFIRYRSSYTTTLTALISARYPDDQQTPATPEESESVPSLLAVIHPGSFFAINGGPGSPLPQLIKEYDAIEKAGAPGRVYSMIGTGATRQAVLNQLPLHQWVHFACYSRLDTSQPSHSAFELEGGPLSISDLIQARLPNTDFAFLAVCDSATSGGTSTTPDESLHLAAAVQFCGVRSVVGTLWPMSDNDGPRVAQVFYKQMFRENDSGKSAEALHKTIRMMRRKKGPWENTEDEGEALQRWANYIHIGA
ncbi:hypothetical protein HWV62_3939 [Athelia sp. TMB]|nr:hypothetical protein HWV62_3939 [Athelia sp. TMB]